LKETTKDLDNNLNMQKTMELIHYCREQYINLKAPVYINGYYTYSIDLSELTGEQYKYITNINGK
jgi:hypothetical protein